MANQAASTVFLAETAPQLTAVMTCLAGLRIGEAVVFFEHNLSFGTETADALLASARNRFPAVRFVELEIKQPAAEASTVKGWRSFAQRWQTARSIREQWDEACRANWGMDLGAFGARVREVYFTALHYYVAVFLAACRGATRVFYPHGFDHPRRNQIKDWGYLVRPRSVRTAMVTLAQQKKHFGPGGLVLGMLGRILPRVTTVSLPFTGVNRVLTFRDDVNYVPNNTIHVQGLAEIFHWLLQLQPWADLLRERRGKARGKSLLLLLSEYNRHPIWTENRNYGSAHLKLLQKVSQITGLKQIVIKAHVRSDGSAAQWLAGFLKEQEKEWNVEILPLTLSGLPVEALALTGEFGAACSLGSCSLPPGLGFGMPHYTSPAVAALFDEGWREDRFWAKYAEATRMLIAEGICLDLDKSLQKSHDAPLSPDRRPAFP